MIQNSSIAPISPVASQRRSAGSTVNRAAQLYCIAAFEKKSAQKQAKTHVTRLAAPCAHASRGKAHRHQMDTPHKRQHHRSLPASSALFGTRSRLLEKGRSLTTATLRSTEQTRPSFTVELPTAIPTPRHTRTPHRRSLTSSCHRPHRPHRPHAPPPLHS